MKIVLSSLVVLLSMRNMNALYKYFWFKRLPCRWHDCISLFSVGSNGRNILIFVYTHIENNNVTFTYNETSGLFHVADRITRNTGKAVCVFC